MIGWEEAGNIVLERLNEEGFEAYIVGGAVRDRLMNRSFRDVDICTNGSIDHIQGVFPRSIDVGVKHGTVIVPIKGLPVEVSCYKERKDGSGSLITDLSLRDFTCNAMALDKDGVIFDPFGGKGDIAKGTIKVVRNSANRFIEDPLRLLRAVRFAIQLGFIIDPKTDGWMREYAPLIAKPSVERIANELEKISENLLNKDSLTFLLSNKVVQQIPRIFPSPLITENEISSMDDNVFIQGTLEWWALSTFSTNLSKTEEILKYYKRSKNLQKNVCFIVKMVNKCLTKSLTILDLYHLGKEHIAITEKIRSIINGTHPKTLELLHRYEQIPIHSKKELIVSGKDILYWFPKSSGLWIGETLLAIEKAVVLGEVINSKAVIYNWLQREYNL